MAPTRPWSLRLGFCAMLLVSLTAGATIKRVTEMFPLTKNTVSRVKRDASRLSKEELTCLIENGRDPAFEMENEVEALVTADDVWVFLHGGRFSDALQKLRENFRLYSNKAVDKQVEMEAREAWPARNWIKVLPLNR